MYVCYNVKVCIRQVLSSHPVTPSTLVFSAMHDTALTINSVVCKIECRTLTFSVLLVNSSAQIGRLICFKYRNIVFQSRRVRGDWESRTGGQLKGLKRFTLGWWLVSKYLSVSLVSVLWFLWFLFRFL